ncbi:MAG: exodeoxyribonuclease VII small subunit [Desulfobacteraceae bacterium]|nr:MAG: exodeoxyribonuclease VII small subunit [Desulfobacteraceae bacterium]
MEEKKFEAAMERLECIVQSLESGDLPLDESLKVFEEGMQLVQFCTKKLDEAERKVSILLKEGSGKLVQKPFETDQTQGEE